MPAVLMLAAMLFNEQAEWSLLGNVLTKKSRVRFNP